MSCSRRRCLTRNEVQPFAALFLSCACLLLHRRLYNLWPLDPRPAPIPQLARFLASHASYYEAFGVFLSVACKRMRRLKPRYQTVAQVGVRYVAFERRDLLNAVKNLFSLEDVPVAANDKQVASALRVIY
eukprot:5763351-Pleurochrysis_carterae.AAC.1